MRVSGKSPRDHSVFELTLLERTPRFIFSFKFVSITFLSIITLLSRVLVLCSNALLIVSLKCFLYSARACLIFV